MLTRPAAQELVDALSAVALGAAMLPIARRGMASPLRARLGFALGGLGVFFAGRAAAKGFDSHALSLLTLLVVCGLPIAALALAEGVLRRHAPTALKAAIALGALATAMALVVADGQAPASSWGLGAEVVLSLLGVTILLLVRDQGALSRQENAGVDALLASGALLTVLSVTDFLPQAPLGLSGLGAASLAFALSANPRAAREGMAVLAEWAATGLVAVAGALAMAGPLGLVTSVERIRLGGVLFALLLAAAAILRAGRGAGSGAVRRFPLALAEADTSSLDRFLTDLADQPLLTGLRVADAALLAEYDADGLGAAMGARAVWTRDALAAAAPRAREELGDLMARTEATHAVMLSGAPLRIALLTLPLLGPAEDAEIHLALFQKLAAVAAKDHPCA